MSTNGQEKKKSSSLKLIRRTFGFVKPFTGLLVLTILLNMVFSGFSAVTIAIIKPILEVIFPVGDSTQAQQSITATGGIGDFLTNIKDSFYSFIQSIYYNPGDKYASLVNLSILIIALFLVKNFFKYLGSIAGVKLEEGIVKSIRDKVFSKLTSLSVEFFTNRREGSLISLITNDVSVVNSMVISSFSGIIRESTQIILFLFLLLSISPYLTIISFSTSIISLFLLRAALKYLKRYASRMQSAMADYTSVLQESIYGIRVVKAYNAEETANKRFSEQTGRFVHSAVKHQKIITLIPSVNEIFAIAALCVVLLVGGSQVLSGTMKSSDLMTFLFLLFSIMSPIATVFNNVSQFQRGFVAAERVFDVLDRQPSVPTGKEAINEFSTGIEVSNVNFAYTDVPVIKNTSFNIGKGKRVAFVGASGSGKSTMLDLIIRFYDPANGSIIIDGKDIKKLRINDYRALFGIVSQETMLFNDTVANNIRYGYDKATLEDIVQAAKSANAYNFIMKMPKGFDTIIGDRGVMLSGGERQRIAIARALVRNPYILVFDEATSALDAESEKTVQDAINNSLENKTAIIVAHRLATVRNCDEILVFDHGKIIERGTHGQLIARNGVYRKLYDIQFAKEALGEEVEEE
jgi:subfamily B ATP-binding cassette protein MsbA